jgi:geranyl-CoA carboxylase alpha subunit
VRLCAEDPQQNYLPQTGPVLRWREPAGAGVRVDSYLREGQRISPFYDSMQAKIIAWGDDRETARMRLLAALRVTTLLGVAHNRDYLAAVLAHDAFASGDFSTAFVERHFPQQRIAGERPPPRHVALAAVALYLDAATALADAHQLAPEFIGWHSSHEVPVEYRLTWQTHEYRLGVQVGDGRRFTITHDGASFEFDVTQTADGRFCYRDGSVQRVAHSARDGELIWLDAGGTTAVYRDVTLAPAQGAVAGSDGRLLAHSDGKIVAVHVQPGDTVAKGQTLIVLEAMKMEFQLALPVDGTVETISVQPGQQVRQRQVLAVLKSRSESIAG